MSEGEFKKRNAALVIQSRLYHWVEIHKIQALFDTWVDEARKDFLKDFTEDDLFVLKEYGIEDDAKLHPDAIKLKSEILARWAKQSVPAFLKWLAEPENHP